MKNKKFLLIIIFLLSFIFLPVKVDAATKTVQFEFMTTTSKHYAIYTYTTSETNTSYTVTVTKVQLRNSDTSAWDLTNSFFDSRCSIKIFGSEVTKYSGTIAKGATITAWSGSKSKTYTKGSSASTQEVATASSFLDSAHFEITIPKASYTLTVNYNINGGVIADAPHQSGSTYFKVANNLITSSSSANGTYAVTTSSITLDTYLNLWNVETYNATRAGYHIDGTAAYRTVNPTTGALINQDTASTTDTNPATPYRLNNNEEVTANKTVTLYINWIPNTYTVKFDPNGGIGTMKDQTFTYDKEQNLNKNLYTRRNYRLLEWNTKADGTGTSYTDKESVKNLTTTNNGTVTLYAQWKQAVSIKQDEGELLKDEDGVYIIGNDIRDDISYSNFNMKIYNDNFETYMTVQNNECEDILLEPGTYKIKEILGQEYSIETIEGISSNDGSITVEAGNTYEVTFVNTFNKKDYLHSYGRARNKVEIGE